LLLIKNMPIIIQIVDKQTIWNNAKIKIIPSTWLLLNSNNGKLNVIYLLYAYNFTQPLVFSCILYNRINQRTAAGV